MSQFKIEGQTLHYALRRMAEDEYARQEQTEEQYAPAEPGGGAMGRAQSTRPGREEHLLWHRELIL